MANADRKTLNLVIQYLKLRNAHKYGYLKYYYFKRIIWYITGERNPLNIRAIFQRLLDDGIIHKQQLYRGSKKIGLRYYFNPYEENEIFQHI